MRMLFRLFLVLLISALAEARADDVRYLDTPEKTISAMYSAIAGARDDIKMNYYEIDPCSTSVKVLVKALIDRKAANPQLKVSWMGDAFPFASQKLAGEFAAYLKQNGIQFALFNPLHGVTRIDHRSHAKYLAVDGTQPDGILITGSTNLADTYFGMSKRGINQIPGANYINRDVWIQGPAAAVARDHLTATWNNTAVTGGAQRVKARDVDIFKRTCFKWGERETALEDYLKANAARIVSEQPVISCQDTRFYADSTAFWAYADYNPQDPQNMQKSRSQYDKEFEAILMKKDTTRVVLDFLTDPAHTRFSLENYIYAPAGRINKAFAAIRKRQVPALVYTNYFLNSREVFENEHNKRVVGDSQGFEDILSLPLVDQPSQHWPFSVANSRYQNHSKTFIANGEDVIVSSFNLDSRSYQLNVETAAVFNKCPALATAVETARFQLMQSLTETQLKAVAKRSHGVNVKINSTWYTDLRDFFLRSQL